MLKPNMKGQKPEIKNIFLKLFGKSKNKIELDNQLQIAKFISKWKQKSNNEWKEAIPH